MVAAIRLFEISKTEFAPLRSSPKSTSLIRLPLMVILLSLIAPFTSTASQKVRTVLFRTVNVPLRVALVKLGNGALGYQPSNMIPWATLKPRPRRFDAVWSARPVTLTWSTAAWAWVSPVNSRAVIRPLYWLPPRVKGVVSVPFVAGKSRARSETLTLPLTKMMKSAARQSVRLGRQAPSTHGSGPVISRCGSARIVVRCCPTPLNVPRKPYSTSWLVRYVPAWSWTVQPGPCAVHQSRPVWMAVVSSCPLGRGTWYVDPAAETAAGTAREAASNPAVSNTKSRRTTRSSPGRVDRGSVSPVARRGPGGRCSGRASSLPANWGRMAFPSSRSQEASSPNWHGTPDELPRR